MSLLKGKGQKSFRDDESTISKKSNNNLNKADESLRKRKKTILNPEQFMRNDTFKVLCYYIISVVLSSGFGIAFHLVIINSLQKAQIINRDSKALLNLNAAHLTATVALKEAFYDNTFFSANLLPYMDNIFRELDLTLDPGSFESTLDWVNFAKGVYKGTPCEVYRNLLTDAQIQDCYDRTLQKLATGLVTYHTYFRDQVTKFLKGQATNFGQIDINAIYDYGQSNSIIDDVFTEEMLKEWTSSLSGYISQQLSLLILLMVLSSLLYFVVFLIAQSTVLGTLRSRFLFFRKVYNNYMLNGALQKEKKIAAILRKYKLLAR